MWEEVVGSCRRQSSLVPTVDRDCVRVRRDSPPERDAGGGVQCDPASLKVQLAIQSPTQVCWGTWGAGSQTPPAGACPIAGSRERVLGGGCCPRLQPTRLLQHHV
eukprot:1377119-Rhodomonas_salina.1